MTKNHRFEYNSAGIPTAYYNVFADAKIPGEPPMDPETGAPVTPQKMGALFPMGLLEQEMGDSPRIPIPSPILEAYALYRPTPLRRAMLFERAIDTRCRIFFKYEGASPVGSHKLNTAIAQAYYNHPLQSVWARTARLAVLRQLSQRKAPGRPDHCPANWARHLASQSKASSPLHSATHTVQDENLLPMDRVHVPACSSQPANWRQKSPSRYSSVHIGESPGSQVISKPWHGAM